MKIADTLAAEGAALLRDFAARLEADGVPNAEANRRLAEYARQLVSVAIRRGGSEFRRGPSLRP